MAIITNEDGSKKILTGANLHRAALTKRMSDEDFDNEQCRQWVTDGLEELPKGARFSGRCIHHKSNCDMAGVYECRNVIDRTDYDCSERECFKSRDLMAAEGWILLESYNQIAREGRNNQERVSAHEDIRDLMAEDLRFWMANIDIAGRYEYDQNLDADTLLLLIYTGSSEEKGVVPRCHADRIAAALMAGALDGDAVAWREVSELIDRDKH